MKSAEARSCYNSKTNTITVTGNWTSRTLNYVMSCNSLTSLGMTTIIVPYWMKLTIRDRNLKPKKIYVADNATLYTSSATLHDINNDGVCIFREKTDVKGMINRGQIRAIGGSRLEDVTNKRHIYLGSRSYMYHCYMTEISSLDVSNSFVVDCDAHNNAHVNRGTGYFVGCAGKLALYSKPGIGHRTYVAPDLTKQNLENDLWVAAVHYNAQTCNRLRYHGRKSANVVTEYTDIQTMLLDPLRPNLSAILAQDLLEANHWPNNVDNIIKHKVSLNKTLRLPY